MSGGQNALVTLPDGSADPDVTDWDTTFVGYLRMAMLERAGIVGRSPEIDAWVANAVDKAGLEAF